MKKTKISNLLIIDASSSMRSKEAEVKDGLKTILNQILTDAKKDKKKVVSSTIVVDFANPGDFRTLVNSKDSLDIDPNLADGYKPRGMTALYDAILKSFSLVPKDAQEVFVNIFTDGEENSSREGTLENIQDLIKEKKTKNWTITFLGTSENDLKAATSMGISAKNTAFFQNSSIGVQAGMKKVLKARRSHYAGASELTSMSLDEQQSYRSKMDNLMDDTDDKK